MKRFRVISSLAWLSIFFFALSGRTVHVLFEHGHEHEFVCKETTTHVHEKPHSCFICEFDLQLSDGHIDQQPSVPAAAPQSKAVFAFTAFIAAAGPFHFDTRGPPAV